MKRRSSTPAYAEGSGRTATKRASRGSRFVATASTGNEIGDSCTGRRPGNHCPSTTTSIAAGRRRHQGRESSVQPSTQDRVVPSRPQSRHADSLSHRRSSRRIVSTKLAPTTALVKGKGKGPIKRSADKTLSVAASPRGGRLPLEIAASSNDCLRASQEQLAGIEAAMLAKLLSPVSRQGERDHHQTRDSVASVEAAGAMQANCGGKMDDDRHGNDSAFPLESMFLALEQVLPLFRRRRQATLLKHVRTAVEGMCGRSFTRQHFAKIVHVQPDAYKISSKTDARPTRGGYHLRDIFIELGGGEATEDSTSDRGSDSARTNASRDIGGTCSSARVGGGDGVGVGETLPARRRRIFHELLKAARARHCKCAIVSKDAPDTTRECPCLPEASLPDTSPLPVSGLGIHKKVGVPIEAEAGHGGQSNGTRGIYRLGGGGDGDDDVEGSSAQKSVENLRERLRKKDALSALERNKSEEEKHADKRRKGNLPAMADAIRSFFAHSRRNTSSLDALVEALASSSRHALSGKEAKERVRMLAGIVPEWCTIIAPPQPSGVRGRERVDGSRRNVQDTNDGMVAGSMKAKEVVRVNTRIHFGEVRQMIVFMAGAGSNGKAP